MAKTTIQTLDNLQNEPVALGKLNANFASLAAAAEKALSRDGTAPNVMEDLLDMSEHPIINLRAPLTPTEPARHGDIQKYVDEAHAWADEAHVQADRSEEAADHAEDMRDEVEVRYQDYVSRYLLPQSTAPVDPTHPPGISGTPYGLWDETLNPDGIREGALNYDTTAEALRVFATSRIKVDGEQVTVNGAEAVVAYWLNLPVAKLIGLDDVVPFGIQNFNFLEYINGEFFPRGVYEADEIPFDNTGTDLTSVTVQDALSETQARFLPDIFDLAIFAQGLMTENDSLGSFLMSRNVTLPAAAPGSLFRCRVNPAGDTQVILRKNGMLIGSIDITTAGVATFTVPGSIPFVAGDLLELLNPAVVDTAMKDVSVTLVMSRDPS